MASFLDKLLRRNIAAPSPAPGGVNALAYPAFEITSPQYPIPNPYNLMQGGYRLNELLYACTDLRATTISEAPLWIYEDEGDKTPKELADHPLRELMAQPNPYMDEAAFWRATEIYLCCAGFAAWEIEMTRMGEPLALHPLRPDWCSFMRGADGRPLAWLRYRPYGMNLPDIPIENVLLFQYFDPLYPMLRGLSPLAIASRVASVDNNATDFLKLFFERGAVVQGILTSDQSVSDAEAKRTQDRWRSVHGGSRQWAENNIAVLGAGLKYESTQMDNRSMQFNEIDARSEARICTVMKTEPILLNAKIGLDRSTYSNYEQARQAFYQKFGKPEWRFLAGAVKSQLLPKWEQLPAKFIVEFELSEISALQEDRTAKWARATGAFEKNLLTRDEAREEMGLDAIDAKDVFYGEVVQAVRETIQPTSETVGQEGVVTESEQQAPGQPPPEPGAANKPPPTAPATDAAKQLEKKQYKAWLTRGAAKGKPFTFQHLDAWEQLELKAGGEGASKSLPSDPMAGVARRFQTELTGIVNDAWQNGGKINKDMRALVRQYVEDAFDAGLLDGGSSPDALDAAALVDQLVADQLQYVSKFAKDVADAQDDPAQQQSIRRRIELWSENIWSAGQRGWAQAHATRKERLIWASANDEIVCAICGPLNGKIVEAGKPFAPGIYNEPAHVNCRCITQPYRDENG